ncbi:MAG: hypothetical protein JXR37_02340 [Kiritimatiellae bacterium]|nr:hypothetical protein [Kiritimatiellia bacterium]
MSGPDEKGNKEQGQDPTESILIDLSITQTPLVNIPALQEAYRQAVAQGKDRFVFEGRKFHTKATKYLLERITGKKID